MKAVILAAGFGTRMGELCKNTPKPMLKIRDKNLLEYKISVLPKEVDEVIMVIYHLGGQITGFFGNHYQGKKITYIIAEPQGTGFALWQAKNHLLNDQFIVMCGDDLYSRKDIEECIKHPLAALVYKTQKPQGGGKVVLDENNCIEDIKEGQHEAGITIATGLYVSDKSIFDLPLVLAGNGKNEFGLPQTLMQIKNKIKAVYASAWYQVTTPEDLHISQEKLKDFL